MRQAFPPPFASTSHNSILLGNIGSTVTAAFVEEVVRRRFVKNGRIRPVWPTNLLDAGTGILAFPSNWAAVRASGRTPSLLVPLSKDALKKRPKTGPLAVNVRFLVNRHGVPRGLPIWSAPAKEGHQASAGNHCDRAF